jgi:hypothetical protein
MPTSVCHLLFTSAWVGDDVEVVRADEDMSIAMAESQVDNQGKKMKCLTGRDLTGYNYVS